MVSLFIDFFALLGLVYDRKVGSPEFINKRAIAKGDGTRKCQSKNQTIKGVHEIGSENCKQLDELGY
jgi:hypothetical protein